MGFIEKYLETRESEKFVIDKSIILSLIIPIIISILLILYLFFSYTHVQTIILEKKISEIYFFHYRYSVGFFPPLVFIFLFIISFFILIIFLIFMYRFKEYKTNIFDAWLMVQFIVNELFIINILQHTYNIKYPIWSFIDGFILWNIFVAIFIPFLTILLLVKITKKWK